MRKGQRGPGGPMGERARSSARPVRAAVRPAATPRVKRTSGTPSERLTSRTIALIVVLAVLALGYAYPIRVYLTQRSEIAAIEQAQIAQQRRIAELEEEALKWKDEEYQKIQIRKRLFWVERGEIPLMPVWDPDGPARDKGLPPKPPAPDTWWDSVWESVTN